jgi:hypothetical protein
MNISRCFKGSKRLHLKCEAVEECRLVSTVKCAGSSRKITTETPRLFHIKVYLINPTDRLFQMTDTLHDSLPLLVRKGRLVLVHNRVLVLLSNF